MTAACQVCGVQVERSEIELDLQGRAACRSCHGHAAARSADEQLGRHGVRRRCSCGEGTLQQQEATEFGELRGGGIGGYSRAPVVIGYRYHCERCGRRVWLASGVGAGIYLFVAFWFSVVLLFTNKNAEGLMATAIVAVALGAREAWMRHRYPSA